LVIVAGALYVTSARRVTRLNPDRPWSTRRMAAFIGGLVAVLVATESILGVYEGVLFYDHMIQHLLLIMVAAPLLAMGAPAELLERSTTGEVHQIVDRCLSSKVAEAIAHPVVDFVLYAFLIPLCHLTNFFNLTLEHPTVQFLEHVMFLVVGYLFWRHVVAIEPSRHRLHPGVRLVFLALAVPIDTFTGLTLASTSHEMFSAYLAQHRSWGPSPVLDLHIGGDIMWVGGDTLMFLGMAPVAVLWVRHEERRAVELDRQLDEAQRQAAHGPGGGATPTRAFEDP
jgi:putative copper resistance protein D